MSNLSDFLNLLSEAKKEVDTLENKQTEPLVEIVEKPKRKKINTSKLFENLKDTSFLNLLESEASKSKKISKLEEKKENEFFDLLSSIPISKHQVVEPIIEDVVIEPIIIEEELIQIVEPIIEDVVVEPILEVKSKDLTDGSQYDKLFKSNVDLFNQPKNPKVSPDIKALTDKIQYMENWLSKISMAGPGGGAGEIYNLDMPTKVVYGDYTISKKDYYVGVNSTTKSYITLPDNSIKNGRVIVIKDESGNSSIVPIKVNGNIDNDPNGLEIRINNAAIQLIYRNGWRII